MYILYGGPYTRALITEMVMAEGDLAYELRVVNIVKQEQRSPEFLAVNPAGLVPVLITPDGEALHETPAINLYLAERHGLTQLAPRVDEPERGRFLSGLFYLTDEFEPVMKRYYYPHRSIARVEDIPTMKRQSLDAALERLSVVEQRLRDGGPYHLGARFSLVDLTLAYWVVWMNLPDKLEPYPAIRHCAQLVMGRPKLRTKFEELRALRDDYAQMQARGEGAT